MTEKGFSLLISKTVRSLSSLGNRICEHCKKIAMFRCIWWRFLYIFLRIQSWMENVVVWIRQAIYHQASQERGNKTKILSWNTEFISSENTLHQSSAGVYQWRPENASNIVQDAHESSVLHLLMMFTTGIALKVDPEYRKIPPISEWAGGVLTGFRQGVV